MSSADQGAELTTGRWLTVSRTLCFILNGGDVLLMKRSPHKRIFPNRYNGIGGHVERDEDVLTSARREIREESGLDVHDLRLCAVHNIDSGAASGILLFVFVGSTEVREVSASEEGELHWVPIDGVSALPLVDDIRTILPRVLALKPDDQPLFVHVGYNRHDAMALRFAIP
jgi:8-oxo-dGTP diphosphatase